MRYRFGQCELVPGTRELRVAAIVQAVEPQVFDLILFLLEKRDRVVSQDELIQAVWGGRIVSDSAIAARISAARAAIGDDGATQALIKTVRGRGFRFVGLVSIEGALPPGSAAAPAGIDAQRVAFTRSPDGTRIAYAASGGGYPLVKAGHWLTHLDHDAKSSLWQPFFDELGSRFSLWRYDQRGNGLSDWEVSDFAFDRFVEDLGSVADAAGLDRFALLGSSQGAPIAIAYAARYPERVSHLILAGGFERGRLVRGSIAEREQGEAILTLIRHGWGKRGSAFLNAFASMFIPGGSKDQIESLVDLQRLTTSPENAVKLRAAVDGFDVSGILANVRTPTLVIHARDDGIQPLDEGRRLAAGIPGAAFVLLESANHVTLPQEPAWHAMFAAIERFVGVLSKS
jgi:pimeloyl-ACP methyl ester carboxylesterase/DNA-binding winged helix-turn-helix (wHTH) protein